ncbi:ABC transporter permease [Ekhidna sp.]|uniref:ABC transporter permease n=1 Tax=Ekhidna sp. TaxID=2608089 RepID=UPI0032990B90
MMDQWLTFPWLETFTMSVLIIGGLTGLLLLLNKYPSGRWLGILTLTYVCAFGTKQFDNPDLTPVFIVPAAVSFFLYCNAFFFQKKRIKVVHLMPVLAMLGVLFAAFDVSLLNASAGLLTIGYIGNTLKLMVNESRSRGFSYVLNSGGRIAWFRNFAAFNLGFLVAFFLELGTLFYSVLFLLFLAQILYQVLNESDFFAPIPIGNKYKKSTLNPAIKSSILEKLEAVMETQQFYKRDDASLSALADELGATTHHLSQVLNESLQISFQDLLARYRIREACQMLRQEKYEQVKIENIATMVGYNSKSAFNTAFKKRTGLTPSDYREAKNVRSYGEERLTERKAPQNRGGTFDLNHVFNLKIKSGMIQHFFKSFSRNIKRNALFSFLNVLGLTVGFTCSILIYLYVQDERSYDRTLPDSERIYRIAWMGDNPQTRTPHPMAQAMVNDFPEVEEAVSFSPWYGPALSKDFIRVENEKRNIIFEEPDFFFADSTFFEVFELELVEGDKDALKKPFAFVITESLAKKYFGDSSAIGQELRVNQMPIAVSAVVKPMPENSHFHFNAIIPYVTLKQINPNDAWMKWGDFGHFNYIKLQKGVNADILEGKIPAWVENYLDWDQSDIERLRSGELRFELQPIEDIHLTSHIRWELENNGNNLYIYILSGTMLLILIIVSINYANLTTAKAIERAKEIGVRKTLGAVARNLSIQFFIESFLFCLIALVCSLFLAGLLLNGFNELAGKDFSFDSLLVADYLVYTLLLCFSVSILAGFYPAITLSSFQPAEVLKGKLKSSNHGVGIRSALVVVQFTISAILISGSFIVFKQIQFMKTTDLGFDQEAVIALNVPMSVEIGGVDVKALRTAQNQMENINGVSGTILTSSVPGGQFNQHQFFLKHEPENRIDISSFVVDYDVEKVLGIEVIQGRTFNRSHARDSLYNVLVNEAAVEQYNLEDPLGKTIVQRFGENVYEHTIIGVIENFHFQSLHEEIQPLVLSVQPPAAGHILVKLEGQEFGKTISEIERVYTSHIDNDVAFEYYFLDNQLGELYNQEERTLSIFAVFALIGLLLASLGLLGMSIAVMNQRVKEVGMRKILGASTIQIMGMILSQFTRLVLVAMLIGLPISYLLMQTWIKEFSYQAPFGFLPFLLSGIILMAVAIISVISAVAKISYSNPVEALRYE